MTALSDWNDLFTAFLFGNGAWLGFMLFEIFIIALTFKWKYAGIIMIFSSLFLSFEYFDNALGWQGLGMILNIPFIVTMLARNRSQ